MKLPERLKRHAFLLICLLGIAYVAISLANAEHYASDKATDLLKLGLVVLLCGVGFFSGREYFRFTQTTPVFLAAMSFLILFHVTELTEEFAMFQSVPLFGESTLAKRAFETTLMIGSFCLFLGGNFLSVSEISKAKTRLESNLHRLRERERRYGALFEAANDAILIMQGDRIVDCNLKTLTMLGGVREQIIGASPHRFSPHVQPDGQDSREKALEKLAKVRAGEPQSFEWRHMRCDGTPFDAEISLNLVQLSDGPCIQAIVRDISERKRAGEKVMAYQRRLRSLASELSLAEERERRRIARGLHDHACQTLVLSKMKLQGLRGPLSAPDVGQIADICSALDRTIGSVRELVFDLSSPTLYKFGLEAALEELLADKLSAENGIHYVFSDDGAPKPLAEDVRIVLYQSVRELLINIIKHAQAREVTFDIARQDNSVRIAIVDDGVGFDAESILSAPSRSQGFGLFNIKERLDHIGGSLDIHSRIGQGSRITLVARLEAEAKDADRPDPVRRTTAAAG